MALERIVVQQGGVWRAVYVEVQQTQHPAAMADLIDKEARRRIVARYSDGTREQMLGEMSYLLYQAALLREPLTPEQIARADELLAAWEWVTAVQAAAAEIKTAVEAMTMQQVATFNIAGAPQWPT